MRVSVSGWATTERDIDLSADAVLSDYKVSLRRALENSPGQLESLDRLQALATDKMAELRQSVELKLADDLAPGTYTGFCMLHFTEMVSTIEVVPKETPIPSATLASRPNGPTAARSTASTSSKRPTTSKRRRRRTAASAH